MAETSQVDLELMAQQHDLKILNKSITDQMDAMLKVRRKEE